MEKIYYKIAVYCLKKLQTAGMDISLINPQSEKQESINSMSSDIVDLQAEISIKRAEVIENQADLLSSVEPVLFNTLSNSNNAWDSSIITQIWMTKLNKINNIILDHENLIKKLETAYYKLEQVNYPPTA